MCRVLIIEYNDEVRASLAAYWKKRRHEVYEAADGETGLIAFRRILPDLVIVALLLPLRDGFEVIADVRKERADQKIIATCEDFKSMPAGVLLKMAAKLGARQVLAKPFSLTELDLVSNALLGRPDQAYQFLVLDDDLDARFLNRRALNRAFPGSSVLECDSLESALAASADKHFDAVITDHHLGHQEGATFVERLRTLGAECPVIMVTGSVDPAVHKKAYRAGADRVFFGFDRDFTGYLKERLSA